MTIETQLKLQAYLDGELSVGEARQVEIWLAEDHDARSLLGELKNTKAALSSHSANVELPESREFYWNKIEREIQRLEKAESVPPTVSIFGRCE